MKVLKYKQVLSSSLIKVTGYSWYSQISIQNLFNYGTRVPAIILGIYLNAFICKTVYVSVCVCVLSSIGRWNQPGAQLLLHTAHICQALPSHAPPGNITGPAQPRPASIVDYAQPCISSCPSVQPITTELLWGSGTGLVAQCTFC